MKPNIYLDVFGVLIDRGVHPANHSSEFLRYILTEYPETTHWLTTLCKGNASVPLEYIGPLYQPKVREMMKKIKPTSWEVAKTRAIDFSKPFLWFDDNLFEEEKEDLIKHDALSNWIGVDLYKSPNALAGFLKNFPTPVKPL